MSVSNVDAVIRTFHTPNVPSEQLEVVSTRHSSTDSFTFKSKLHHWVQIYFPLQLLLMTTAGRK